MTALNAAANTPYPLGVYVSNPNNSDPANQASFITNLNSFEQTMGAAPAFMDTYIDYNQPISGWPSNNGFNAGSWVATPQLANVTPVIGLPLTSTASGNPDQDYKDFASGKYDALITGLVQTWAGAGYKTQYWRPGWEMNLNAVPTNGGTLGSQEQKDWIAAFQHVATVLHDAGQTYGADVQTVWNPGVTSWGSGGNAVADFYPGNQYVDVIGADVYSDAYPYSLYDFSTGKIDTTTAQWEANPANLMHYYTYPAGSQWSNNDSAGHATSLQDLIDLAKSTGKPLAVVETGAGDSMGPIDNPVFVQWLAQTLQQSGVPIKFVNIWDSNGGGSYGFSNAGTNKPLEAAAWAKYFGATVSPPTPAPPPAPPVVTPPLGPVVLGSGPDVLALQVAEDAWQGDAQYTVSVGGTQIGGVQTATAIHRSGAIQTVNVMGSFAPGKHTATVNFLNDAYGGSSTTDRNLFVMQASIDNTAIPSSSLTELSAGPQSFTFQGAAADTLTLGMSEDAWNGDAQYTVSVDGQQAGGIYTATASNAAGRVSQQTIGGSWGKGAHTVGVTFINDAWGGTSATDRNLYINAVNYDGTQVAMSPIAQLSNGTASIATSAVPNILTLHLAEDAYQGDAQFTMAIDGKQMGAAQYVTASNANGATQAFNFAVLGAGAHDVAVSFLNDAWGGSSALDRNLYVAGADLNGSALGAAPWTAALLTTSTTHFSLVVP